MQSRATEEVYAGFFVRLAAYIIDWLIVEAALCFVRIPLWIFSLSYKDNIIFQDLIFKYSIKDILLYVLLVMYFILLTYYTGSTLGKKLLHIQVISSEGQKLTFFQVVFRETVGRFLAELIIFIGYLMVIVTADKRGLHDILSDTMVVYHHEKRVYVQTPVSYQNIVLPQGNGSLQNGGMPPQNNGMPLQNNSMPQNNGMPPQNSSMPQNNGMPPQNSSMPQNSDMPPQDGISSQDNASSWEMPPYNNSNE